MSESSRVNDFLSDLSKEVARLAKAHNLEAAPFNTYLDGTACHIDLSVFLESACAYYQECYIRNSALLGLNPAWLGGTMIEMRTGMTWTVMGLDPNGGSKPVRIKNTKNEQGHISAAELHEWMTKEQHL